jgi:hypothetical protein
MLNIDFGDQRSFPVKIDDFGSDLAERGFFNVSKVCYIDHRVFWVVM